MSCDGRKVIASPDIPDSHRLIPTAAKQAFAIGTKGYAIDRASMPKQAKDVFPALQIPYFYRMVVTGSGEEQAIRAEGREPNTTGVACQGEMQLSGLCVPDFQGFVPATRRQQFAVGAIYHVSHGSRMA